MVRLNACFCADRGHSSPFLLVHSIVQPTLGPGHLLSIEACRARLAVVARPKHSNLGSHPPSPAVPWRPRRCAPAVHGKGSRPAKTPQPVQPCCRGSLGPSEMPLVLGRARGPATRLCSSCPMHCPMQLIPVAFLNTVPGKQHEIATHHKNNLSSRMFAPHLCHLWFVEGTVRGMLLVLQPPRFLSPPSRVHTAVAPAAHAKHSRQHAVLPNTYYTKCSKAVQAAQLSVWCSGQSAAPVKASEPEAQPASSR